jgi:FAD/FMN-containing dehydrogenase
VRAHDAALRAFAGEVGSDGPVAAEGGRTRWRTGGDLDEGTRLVRAPSGVVEHRPEEMTVRVRAGTTVEELHAALGETRQRTSLPSRGGTVGGALSVGENHVSVLGRGRVRDAVLEVRYVSADGVLVIGGGPTVKNVTGFDLPRLLVGSLGTLGLLGEVVLRTNPVPAAQGWLRAEGVDPFGAARSLFRPACVLWDGSCTWVELEGHSGDVRAEGVALRSATRARWDACEGPPTLPSERWSLRPGDLRDLDAALLGPFVASIGTGAVFASRPQPPRPSPPALASLGARVKQAFDPTSRLNPGRAVMPAP